MSRFNNSSRIAELTEDWMHSYRLNGRRLRPAEWIRELARLSYQQGYENTVAIVDSLNTPSLAVLAKLGAERIAALDYYRIGVWIWTKFR